MKYEVKFTSHFKKDYKLAQSAVWICPFLLYLILVNTRFVYHCKTQ